jgi:Flp pilus assembly protein TadG
MMRDYLNNRLTKRVGRTGLPVLGKQNQSCRGQALVEFTLVAMAFFLLAFGAIDFSWLLFNQMNMQDAVREAARYASTGYHLPNPSQPGTNLSRIASIDQILTQTGVPNTVQSITISSVSGGVGSAGGPGDIVTVQANCSVPLLTYALGTYFSGHKFNFTVSATFKNEPFPPALTY